MVPACSALQEGMRLLGHEDFIPGEDEEEDMRGLVEYHLPAWSRICASAYRFNEGDCSAVPAAEGTAGASVWAANIAAHA